MTRDHRNKKAVRIGPSGTDSIKDKVLAFLKIYAIIKFSVHLVCLLNLTKVMSRENTTRMVGWGTLGAGALAVQQGMSRESENLLYMGAGLEVIALLAFASLLLGGSSRKTA